MPTSSDVSERMQMPVGYPSSGQTLGLAIGASSVASAAALGVEAVRVLADVNCYIALAADPTAAAPVNGGAAGSMPLQGGVPEYVACKGSDKIAVIQRGAVTGSLWVTKLS